MRPALRHPSAYLAIPSFLGGLLAKAVVHPGASGRIPGGLLHTGRQGDGRFSPRALGPRIRGSDQGNHQASWCPARPHDSSPDAQVRHRRLENKVRPGTLGASNFTLLTVAKTAAAALKPRLFFVLLAIGMRADGPTTGAPRNLQSGVKYKAWW